MTTSRHWYRDQVPRTALAMAVVAAMIRPVGAGPAPCIVNADGQTYDSHPAMVVAADGTTWVAWHAYQWGRDRVLLRRIDAQGVPGPLQTVSQAGRVHGPPCLVQTAPESLWVVWAAQAGERWQVLARRRSGQSWGDTMFVSADTGDAIYPSAASAADGRLLVAWSAYEDGRFRVFSRRWENDVWQPPQAVSQADRDAYRSVFAVQDSQRAWLFWDAYDGRRYGIRGRRVFPAMGPIGQVSPDNGHCLMPAALATDRAMYVAWLAKTDVIGEPGAVSQWHELKMAVRSAGGWDVVVDGRGRAAAAELTHGLMAKIKPKPIATWGYLGRRTQPMLLEDDGDVWLLWERKTDHLGSTPNATGDLVGRPMRDGRWQRPVVLYQGRVDYRMASPSRAKHHEFVFVASQLPRQRRRLYHRLTGRLDTGSKFEQDQWVGWQAVNLPIEKELTERREIRVGDRSYKLYWADLHCHSALSADAEGMPDELTYYARDRARLDAVAFTENDFIYDVPLTEYEYQLGNLLARAFTRDGRFISLSAYEWTSRVPADPAASITDPGNWTPPYNKGSRANHRSVLYPSTAGPLLRYCEVGNDIDRLNRAVAQAGGLTLTQHDRFRPSGHAVEVGMELVSGWSNYIARRPGTFYDALNGGARLACVANGDSHRRAPGLSGGLTGIYAEKLTTTAILDALRQRRCYATSGSRIFLDSRANGRVMGQTVQAVENKIALTLEAIGTRPITAVTLIRDGRELKAFSATGSCSFHASYDDSRLTPGTHWYLWRVSQQGSAPALPGNLSVAHGRLAWTSPHWVVAK